jgi:hypothetical protein
MTVETFINKQPENSKKVFKILDTLIREYDKMVSVEVNAIMGCKAALVYKQEGVFKYGIAATKHHFSYHSMVMYCYPDLLTNFKKTAKGIKFQKGCFNFKTIDAIDMTQFKTVLQNTAKQDFSPILQRYLKKL